jgi:hypothetical protein
MIAEISGEIKPIVSVTVLVRPGCKLTGPGHQGSAGNSGIAQVKV